METVFLTALIYVLTQMIKGINSTGCASVSLYGNDDKEDKQTPSSNKDESMGSQNSIFEGHNLVYLLGTVILEW